MRMFISEKEYLVLNDVVAALQPLKIGIERLGRRGATLLEAEGVFVFILDELRKNNNSFLSKMLEFVQQRIVERRNSNLVGLLKYLNNASNYNTTYESEVIP